MMIQRTETKTQARNNPRPTFILNNGMISPPPQAWQRSIAEGVF